MKLDKIKRAELKALAEKATPGPYIPDNSLIHTARQREFMSADFPNHTDNAKFAAGAMNALPDALADIEELEARARRWYRADGSYEDFTTEDEVIAKRKEAAKTLARVSELESKLADAVKELEEVVSVKRAGMGVGMVARIRLLIAKLK